MDWAKEEAAREVKALTDAVDHNTLPHKQTYREALEERWAAALLSAYERGRKASEPKCSVELPMCGGVIVLPNVCTVFATVDGEMREGDVEATWNGVGAVYSGLFYKTLPGGVIETTSLPLAECHPTREAAEAATSAAARGEKCSECGIYPPDHPSKTCCGCDAYREHQQ